MDGLQNVIIDVHRSRKYLTSSTVQFTYARSYPFSQILSHTIGSDPQYPLCVYTEMLYYGTCIICLQQYTTTTNSLHASTLYPI